MKHIILLGILCGAGGMWLSGLLMHLRGHVDEGSALQLIAVGAVLTVKVWNT